MHIPHCKNKGKILSAIVKISFACNVFLLDYNNLKNYFDGSEYVFYGGRFIFSPARVSVNQPGIWYLLVNDGECDSRYSYCWEQN